MKNLKEFKEALGDFLDDDLLADIERDQQERATMSMLIPPRPRHLGFLLSQVGIYASQRFAEAIGEAGIHPPLFRVLNVVDAAEGESQQAIGDAIQAPPSRMVAIVDELEERGLIERRPTRVTAVCVRSSSPPRAARCSRRDARSRWRMRSGLPAA